ncbi:uncharacterized protein LOC133300572, partial [Gastrolobium bilobum]|uniref:uncharacterized protein LOC133300572 n=1 Tax=Gastrolobium bilobum TaxID=150636 RepID=UPI002AB23AA7
MAENTRMRDVTQRLETLEQQTHRLDMLEQQLRSAELVREQQHLDLQESNAQLQESQTQIKLALQRILDGQHSGGYSHSGLLGSGPGSKSNASSSDLGKQRPFKLIFPRFSSGDPTSWLFSVDKYCQYYQIGDEERLLIVSFHLDDPAACWFRGLSDEGLLPTWASFITALHRRFGPSEFDEPIGALAKLQQQGLVIDYQSTFEAAASKVPGLSATMKRGLFISGLKPRIRRSVLTQRPTDWHEALALAKVFEDQQFDEKPMRPWLARQPTATTPTSQHQFLSPPKIITPLGLTSTIQPKPIPAIPIRRLSPAEMQVRREKNLCFNCDEKFVYGHKCKARASLLFLEGPEEDEPPDPIVPDPTEPELQLEEHNDTPEISFNALFGTYSSKSFCLTGSIFGQSIQILIDGGSTHNFITPRVATHLHLTLLAVPQFKVQVGNGDSLTCSAMCQSVPLNIQCNKFPLDLFVLELQGADIVLGVQWLATLGPILTDYHNMTIGFTHQGKHVSLHGDQRIAASLITSSQLQKLLTQKSLDSCLMCLSVVTTPKTATLPPPTSVDQNPDVQQLLDQYRDVFATPSSLPPDRPNNHKIQLISDAKPVQVRPYRYPHFQKNEIEKLVSEMLHNGLIRPSHSAFSSPVLLVKKKDGTWRFCVDYRALNAVTVSDKFPIPTIDELMDELHDATIFSKLDLRSGYHQIKMHPTDIHKPAFRTHHGHYKFLVMPFGLSNAPSTFQATMNQEHINHLQQVLLILRENSLFAKLSKCLFAQPSLQFLGHIISGEGVAPDPSKTQAIQKWPIPQSATQVRAFLGLSGYYRRFIRHYASIAAPLTDLLTKDGFRWSSAASDAFVKLKASMTDTPILALPNFKEPFIVETDASGIGVGAFLLQNNHPIAFYSRKLAPSMRTKSTYIREMFAITSAVAKWRQYLLGVPFTIRTDHKSLHNLMNQVIQTPEQQSFLSKLLGFDYTITYKSGKANIVADALSRHPEGVSDSNTPHLAALSGAISDYKSLLLQELQQDPYCATILTELQTEPAKWNHWKNKEGLLFFRNRIVFPSASSIIPYLLHDLHTSVQGGHSGLTGTLQRIAQSFTWKGMRKTIRQYVANCEICQKIKPPNHSSPY